MALTNLDLDTLRSFAVAHDLGGLAPAAERLGRTPSAISLQMKRLQEELGAPLFRKHGRGLKLTEAGHTVLGYARRMLALNDELLQTMQGVTLSGAIRIGAPQDFAALLPDALRQFASLYRRTQIELRIEGNGALMEALDKSQLDLALTIGFADRKDALLLGELPVLWIASRTFRTPNAPLPLAVLGPQCAFRKAAVQLLETAGIPHRIAATSPSLDGLWAALQGGLGITARLPCNFRLIWWQAGRCIACPPFQLFQWHCTVIRTPLTLPLILFIPCWARQREALWPTSRSRNTPAYYGKHEHGSFDR